MNTRPRGFTLTEMLVAIGVAAILMGIAIPSLSEFIQVNQVSAAAEDLLGDLYFARSEALKRNVPVVLCASPNPTAASPACASPTSQTFAGWVVFVDNTDPTVVNATDNNGVIDATEVVLRKHALLSTGITSSSDTAFVSFAGTGFAQLVNGNQSATAVVFCSKYGNVAALGGLSAARGLQIVPPGRPAVVNTVSAVATTLGTTGGTCP